MDPKGRFVATGQMGKKPSVHIWEADTGLLVSQLLGEKGQRAVVSLAFSSDSKRLISIVNDDNHSATIWITKSGDWTDGALEASQRGDKNPNAFSVAVGDGTFATGGKKSLHALDAWCQAIKAKEGQVWQSGTKNAHVRCNMGKEKRYHWMRGRFTACVGGR